MVSCYFLLAIQAHAESQYLDSSPTGRSIEIQVSLCVGVYCSFFPQHYPAKVILFSSMLMATIADI